ncbi:MAG: hypothetical protein WCV71_03200 [Patescibacteria group bacterium]
MNNQKGFIGILLSIIMTAILVGGATYFWQQQVVSKLISDKTSQLEQQSQDQLKILQEKISDLEKAASLAESENTNNWQTYSNSEYGYSISYLEGWLVKENEYPGCEITACDRIKGSDITITIKRSENELDLKTYIDNKKVGWHANNYYDVKVDNLEAIKEVYDFNQYSLPADDVTSYWSPVNYFIKKDNYIYSIELEIKQQADEQKYRELFGELVGTFKFLDYITADWQTYTNEKQNFTFKYPGEWQILSDSEFDMSVGIVAGKNQFMRLIVNPDGFGPHFPDKVFKLEKSNGHLIVSDEQLVDNGENNNLDTYQIIASEDSGSGLPYFWMSFTDNSGNEDAWDETVKKIITSLYLLD